MGIQYPYVEIAGEPEVRGKCRVNLWAGNGDYTTVYKGLINQEQLRDTLMPILKQYPAIRVRVTDIKASDKDYLHIFRIRDTREAVTPIRSFVRTHNEVPNPFRNRKRYQMVNPNATVSFESLDL